jgi:hypothetical protein
MLEFESTFEEPPPTIEICVVYERRTGRILSMHQFVGDGTGLFGPEGRKERERMALDTVKEHLAEVSEVDRTVMHVPSDFRLEPMTVYRVDVAKERLVTHLSQRDFEEMRRAARLKPST